MQYRIYKDNVKIKETTSRQVEITGLKPKTTYTLGVSAYNGLRESTRATITMTTRGLVMIVDKALPVNSEVTLEYMEYPLGAVPLGTEPAGMFGGGNRQTLQGKVVSVSNGQSLVELKNSFDKLSDELKLVTNLQMPGINLLRQSQLGSNYAHDAWRENFGGITWNSNTVELNVGNKDCVQIEQRIYNIEPDSDYVFSFDLNYADAQHLDKQGFIFWEFKDSEGKQTTNVYKDNWTSMSQLSSVPGRSDKKIVIHTQPDTHMIIFMVRSLKGATQPFRLSKVKFERGNEPTEWSLARQDVYGTDQLDSGFSAFDGYKAIYLK